MPIPPRNFSGDGDVMVWAAHTDRIVVANGWSDQVAAARVMLELTGRAEVKSATYLTTVTASWVELRAQLVRDFELPVAAAKKLLAVLKQGEEETVSAYGSRVEGLVTAAFGRLVSLQEQTFNQLALQYFQEGLRPDIKRVARLKFETIKTVGTLVARLEPLEMDGVFEKESLVVNQMESTELQVLKEQVQKLTVRLAERDEAEYQERVEVIETRTCFNCETVGHLARQCTRPKRGSQSGRAGRGYRGAVRGHRGADGGYRGADRGYRGADRGYGGAGRGYGGADRGYRGGEDRAAMSSQMQCYNCQGQGHRAAECPSPAYF